MFELEMSGSALPWDGSNFFDVRLSPYCPVDNALSVAGFPCCWAYAALQLGQILTESLDPKSS